MTLNYTTWGSPHKPAILFLHGMGVSSWMWHEQVTALQDEFYCITIDMPGNGENHALPWHSFEASAKQIAVLLARALPGRKVHVIGLSYGGYMALHLLHHHPDLVESVLVSGVTARPFARQRLLKVLMQVVPLLIRLEPFIRLNIRLMNLPSDAAALFRRDARLIAPATFRRVYDEIFSFSLRDHIAPRAQPVLAVAGALEAKQVRADLPEFATHFPSARTALVPHAHHGWNGEFPVLFTDMVRSWVIDQRLPSALDSAAARPTGVTQAATPA
jgi:pimeloyl-ACP methyl ester carboxylesterase